MLTILTMLLCVPPAFAETSGPEIFQGTWQGKGTYLKQEKISQCAEFSLVFTAGRGKFEVVGGHRKCDFHEEDVANVKMEARNGELFIGSEKVGTYQQNEIHARYRFPMSDGKFMAWRMNMRRQGTHLLYEESVATEGEATPQVSFAGLLVLQP